MKTAASILEDAARLYEDEKVEWCQGAWVRPKVDVHEFLSGRYEFVYEVPDELITGMNACAMGALALADGISWQQMMKQDAESAILRLGSPQLQEAIDALGDRLRMSVVSWNDRDGRTKEQIISAMKATAKDLSNNQPEE